MKSSHWLTTLLLCALAACSAGDEGALMGILRDSCSHPYDPLSSYQWHIDNKGQFGGVADQDANILPVWSSGICGRGIRIAIVDDGLQIGHEDLAGSIEAGASYNFLTGTTDPTSKTAGHGTSMAGLVAGPMNRIGIHGVAPLAFLRGYNLLQNPGAANEGEAMSRDAANVDVSVNGWGPTSRTGQLSNSSSNWRSAIDTGLSTGRSGKGTVYVWAAGDGAQPASLATEIDNSNYNGYANYYGVTAICAFGQDGKRPAYSVQGANLWVCAPSTGNDGRALATTDLIGSSGYNQGNSASDFSSANYTSSFGGTHGATGIAGGVVALILASNPALSWRDVKIILAQSARKVDPTDSDWAVNGAGMNINHKYGFGAIDAGAAVQLAQTWTNVGSLLTFTSALDSPGSVIADGGPGAAALDNMVIAGTGISKLEFVDITVTFTHPYPGDVRIVIQSPDGTQSVLARERSCRSTSNASTVVACSPTTVTWRFGSARLLGESPDGTWTLSLQDMQNTASLGGAYTINGNGTFTSWQLKFYGR
jgi:proprotein convertase subtilisin/kexin type 2